MVGYDFTLTMKEFEQCDIGQAGLRQPVQRRKVHPRSDGQRRKDWENERSFRVIDTLAKLKQEARNNTCSNEEQRANFIYPIAGTIGLGEVVRTYWRVKGLSTFDPSKDKAFTDKIIFKTVLSAGITPSITVSSSVGDFKLTNFTVDGEVIREDNHQVTVSIASAKPQGTKDAPRGLRSLDEADSFTDSGSGADAAAKKVIDELDRQLYRDNLRDFSPFRLDP